MCHAFPARKRSSLVILPADCFFSDPRALERPVQRIHYAPRVDDSRLPSDDRASNETARIPHARSVQYVAADVRTGIKLFPGVEESHDTVVSHPKWRVLLGYAYSSARPPPT